MFFFLCADIPTFLTTPATEVVVSNGSDTVLNCTVKGFPTPHVWWETNSFIAISQIENTTTTDVSTGRSIVYAVLTVKNVLPEDYGTFTCVAVGTNAIEKAHTNLKISCKYSSTKYFVA